MQIKRLNWKARRTWDRLPAQLAFLSAGLFIASSIVSLTLTTQAAEQPASCGKGWVFFDLGNTLVDTRDWNRLRYMPGALPYLHSLREAGFHLGMITNIPESWGSTNEEKVATLKSEIARTWVEPNAFEWSIFEVVLVPPSDSLRKPRPYLFEQARQIASPCKVAFEGEDPREAQAARLAGFQQVYVVGQDPASFFAPIDTLLPAIRR